MVTFGLPVGHRWWLDLKFPGQTTEPKTVQEFHEFEATTPPIPYPIPWFMIVVRVLKHGKGNFVNPKLCKILFQLRIEKATVSPQNNFEVAKLNYREYWEYSIRPCVKVKFYSLIGENVSLIKHGFFNLI